MSNGLFSQIIEHQTAVEEMLEDVMDGARLQIEQMDYFDGFVQVHSPSGGIGSGFSKLLSQ